MQVYLIIYCWGDVCEVIHQLNQTVHLASTVPKSIYTQATESNGVI